MKGSLNAPMHVSFSPLSYPFPLGAQGAKIHEKMRKFLKFSEVLISPMYTWYQRNYTPKRQPLSFGPINRPASAQRVKYVDTNVIITIKISDLYITAKIIDKSIQLDIIDRLYFEYVNTMNTNIHVLH